MTLEERIEYLTLQNKYLQEQVNSLIKVIAGLKGGTLKIEDVEIKSGSSN